MRERDMRLLLAGIALGLPGCVNLSEMSANQLRATNGMAMCSQATSLYGRGSSITVNADDLKKGQTGKGKTVITCGDSQMVIEHDVGIAPRAP